MTIQQHLSQYASYNLWANQLMIDWLLSKDPAIMEKEVKSSFPTINKTLSQDVYKRQILKVSSAILNRIVLQEY